MADATQTLFSVSIPTLAVMIGILVNNSWLNDLNARLGELRAYMDNRFNGVDQRFRDMEALFTEKLMRVEQVMDARLKHLEERR